MSTRQDIEAKQVTVETREDATWSGVIRWGGATLVTAGLILVAFLAILAISGQELPVPAVDLLEDPTIPVVMFLLVAVGELLLLPGGLALFFALRRRDRSQMLLATGLWVVAVPMFLASRGVIVALARLSGDYLGATGEGIRSTYLVNAQAGLEMHTAFAAMGLIPLALASILIGRVMLRSDFGRVFGWIAIVAGACSVFSPFLVLLDWPDVIAFLGLALGGIWQTVAGWRMFRRGSEF
jgi:protein-S-isoprenylcysteine O-methyltransferase Ste14